MFSKQQNGRAWGGLIWLRIGGKWGGGGCCEHGRFGFDQMFALTDYLKNC